jgi:hypothetical protein
LEHLLTQLLSEQVVQEVHHLVLLKEQVEVTLSLAQSHQQVAVVVVHTSQTDLALVYLVVLVVAVQVLMLAPQLVEREPQTKAMQVVVLQHHQTQHQAVVVQVA